MNLRTVFARMLARDRAGVEPIIKVPTTAGAVAHIADPYLVLGNPVRTLTPASVVAMCEAAIGPVGDSHYAGGDEDTTARSWTG